MTDISLKRKKYMKLNIALSVVLQLFAMITGLIIPHMIVNTYGSEVNGLVSWVTQTFNFFQILEGGVSVAAAVALYKPLAEGDKKTVAGIYKSIGKYYLRTGEWILCLSVVSSGIFVFMFRSSSIYWYTILLIVMFSGITNSLNYLMLGKYNVICDADQHTYVLHTILLIARLVVFVLQYVLISLKLNILIVEAAVALTIIIRLILTYFYVKKKYPYLFGSEKTEAVRFGQKNDALVIQVAQIVKRNAPMLVIGIFGNLGLISIYNTYASIFHATSSLLETASNSLTSNFGNMVVTESKEKVGRVYRKAEWIMTSLISVIMCCYMRLIIPFVTVYSKKYDINYIYVIMAALFTVSEYAANLSVLPRMASISCGYIKESKLPAIIEAASSFVIGTVGFIIFGLNGLMIGCILGSLTRTFYHIWLVSGKILSDKMSMSLFILGSNALLSAVVIFVSGLIRFDLSGYDGIKGYIIWFLLALIVFLISALVIFGGNMILYKISNRRERKKNV